jgi:hypothetical protein
MHNVGVFRLNVFRQPSVWEALRKRGLRRDLEGWGPHIEELLSQEVGMPLGISVQGREILENCEWDRTIPCEDGRATVVESLERLTFMGCQYIVEPDRIRVVSREEAIKFWTAWWLKEGKQ